jgi:methyl-accepting chemotaxis protein
MAAGDFTVQLETDRKDEVGSLLASMQTLKVAVLAMVTDANILAKAAVEGKLATRADASKHEGDFRKIVCFRQACLKILAGRARSETTA